MLHGVAASGGELLGQHTLLEAAALVEQHVQRHVAVLGDMHGDDIKSDDHAVGRVLVEELERRVKAITA